jgi:two-component system phosphate regulon sensor histidine kinase PhoR
VTAPLLLTAVTSLLALAFAVDDWFTRRRLRRVSADEAGERQEIAALQDQNSGAVALNDALLEALPLGVIVTDPQRRIVALNPVAERLCAPSKSRLVGQPLIAAVRDHELDALLRHCLTDLQPGMTAAVSVGTRQIQAWAAPVADNGRGLRGGLLLLADITELHHLRTVRRDFVANISHELRTPLATIRLLLDTLQNGALDDRPMAEHFLGKMELEATQLISLVEQLLELSRVEAGQEVLDRRPAPVHPLVASVLERQASQADQRSIALCNDVPLTLPPVYADAEKISRVVLNLVNNAIKFSSSGQVVRVTAGADGDWVTVSVEDQGAGISPLDLPRIFERFYRSDRARLRDQRGGSPGSSGLGLAIARHVVEAHDGRIWVQSTEGEGSTFFFTLPVAR